MPDAPSQHPFSVQQICQDPSYPGFPQNEKGEAVPLPPFSYNTAGKDLPNGTIFLICFTDNPFSTATLVMLKLGI